MGNAQQGGRLLELRLSRPTLQVPRGLNGKPCAVFAKVSADGGESAIRPDWNEVFTISLPEGCSALRIAVLATDQISEESQAQSLAELTLPYEGNPGLRALGVGVGAPAQTLHLALMSGAVGDVPQEWSRPLRHMIDNFSPQRPHIIVEVRELAPEVVAPTKSKLAEAPAVFDFQVVSARRQVIALELQNTAMAKLLVDKKGATSTAFEMPSLTHRRQLEEVRGRSEQLRREKLAMWQRLERMQEVLSSSTEPRTQPRPLASSSGRSPDRDWMKTLKVMEQELELCQSRQRSIRESYEARIASLQVQIRQARDPSSSPLVLEEDAQALLAIATGRREELRGQLEELVDASAGTLGAHGPSQGKVPQSADLARLPSKNPEVAHLQKLSMQYQDELEKLRQDLTVIADRGNVRGWRHHQEITSSVQQLKDELEELRKVREDERVRSESEISELKRERNAAKDRVEDMLAELRQL
eukprot:gb/GFBE01051413.1/.p1 GENE.gb/GFBE01051413.1/~~gb/GFBE01051413.1/.p1  ORF type:complete len:472 (+),score=115.11 gb/GFBE01051413.1/:1-1416(+)